MRVGVTREWKKGPLSYLSGVRHRRPVVELQVEAADCGYICVSALLALLGRPALVQEIKDAAGTTFRGLTLRQLRDVVRKCGIEADAIRFDPGRTDSFPERGILLLERGHYVVVARRRRDALEIFDPQLGWYWADRRRLRRQCTGLAVNVGGDRTGSLIKTLAHGRPACHAIGIEDLLRSRWARGAIGIFVAGQLLALTLPLLSMWSVDRFANGEHLGSIGLMAVLFFALSLTNVAVSLVGELLVSKARYAGIVEVSRRVFAALRSKPAYWFELNSAAAIQSRLASVNVQVDFSFEVLRAAGTVTGAVLVGTAVLVFVSPWLAVPGLCGVALSAALDLMFERPQRGQIAAAVEAGQRRQAFVLDTLSQMPLLQRHGASPAAGARFTNLVRRSASVDARLQAFRGWRAAGGAFLKAAETLVFVTLAARFMASGEFSIGGFVAIGAYKDLLAGALANVLQLTGRRRTLHVHRLHGAALLERPSRPPPTETAATSGRVRFGNVSFAFGTLDAPTLRDVSFDVEPGECAVIRGASGSGKSTIAKLLVGLLPPSSGIVEVDGCVPAEQMVGVASVLQSDRLIYGSIRENLCVFRRGHDDGDLWRVLKLAALDDFVLGLPMRLNTVVGEGVVGLSGGQRQRLLIARALISRPKLLILDESTSSLEVAVEADILRGLRQAGMTLILIAHRPEVWAFADSIFELEDGVLTGVTMLSMNRSTLQDVAQSA